MKKVALMTWYTYKNYGTALQSTALCNVIRNLGYEVDTIQYKPRNRYIDKDSMSVSSIVGLAANKLKSLCLGYFDGYSRKEYYDNSNRDVLFQKYVREHLKETNLVNTMPELRQLNVHYDAFVCGSDQIWSPLCFDDKYFLSFVNDTQKMISYAPSLGTNYVENTQIAERMKKLLERFPRISVRETQGANIINSLIGKKAEIVCDPTLLLDSDQWNALIGDNQKLNGEYIICYFLGDDGKYSNYVKQLEEILKIPAYVIPVFRNQRGKKIPFEVGPKEFVTLIKHAKYVCTDSYHGMLFALNYNIPFSALPRFKETDERNQNSRLQSVLRILDLEKRLFSYEKKVIEEELFNIDFKKVNSKMDEFRAHSFEFLKSELKRATIDDNQKRKNVNLEKIRITGTCCGCGACASICPVQAIDIRLNEEGFYHYHIDHNKCIHCNRCKVVCPFVNVNAKFISNASALYSLKNQDNMALRNSSSGGAAHILTDYNGKHGAIVSGVVYNSEKRQAEHIIIRPEDKEKYFLLQGSKYIQSYSAEAIKEVALLSKNNKVVYFGTPCQVAGLDNLLCEKGNRDNVLLVDLICHGVPSYVLFNKYLDDINKKYCTGRSPEVKFRSPIASWREIYIYVANSENKYHKSEKQDDFYRFFRRSLCYSKSCYECPYRERSAADIRIGDYWGNKFKGDDTGVSMVITITDYGQKVIKTINNNYDVVINKETLEEYWSVQVPLNPCVPLYWKELIEQLHDTNNDLHKLTNEYCNGYDLYELLSGLKNRLKVLVK